MHADIQDLADQLDRCEADARALVDGLGADQGIWRPKPGAWSISECLDHLATGNRVYLAAMRPSAVRAREKGRLRRGPATPGFLGGMFARSLEPPKTPTYRKLKAPKKIVPRELPPLADAVAAFIASQNDIREFLHTYADIDLAGVTFPNPFVTGLRFSLASGLNVLTAHERRHLWQAANVKKLLPDQ
jgi:hypothetical protein